MASGLSLLHLTQYSGPSCHPRPTAAPRGDHAPCWAGFQSLRPKCPRNRARPRPPSPVLAREQSPGVSVFCSWGPGRVAALHPRPQPLRPFQQCVDDSSDVGEAPSRSPLLLQDVVGLAQGLLEGGARLSSCHLLLSAVGWKAPWRSLGKGG